MNHAFKTFLKIIHKRIYGKCEEKSGDTQSNFKNSLDTREALYIMQLIQKCYDQRKNVFICFINYQKAFDNTRHNLLIPILQETSIDIRIIHELFWNQIKKLKLSHASQTSNIRIVKGIRQECKLSPLLFNIHVEKIFQLALEGHSTGIKASLLTICGMRTIGRY